MSVAVVAMAVVVVDGGGTTTTTNHLRANISNVKLCANCEYKNIFKNISP